MSIEVTWHGHATFTLNINGIKVVVDPFFAGNCPVAATTVDEAEADFILQTHGHSDHIADTVPLAKRTGALVIGNLECTNWVSSKGHDKVHAMNTGGGYTFDFGHVKMTPALHSSSLPDGSYGGDPAGYVVSADGKKIYIAGDTALFSDMALIGRAQDIDLALLPIGDNFTMGPEDALLALDYVKPAVVIPCHYNTWPVVEQDPEAWANRVEEEADCDVVVLGIDETYEL